MMPRWLSRWLTQPTDIPSNVTTRPSAQRLPRDTSQTSSGLRPVQRRDGLVWVDATGKIQILNPRGQEGRYPVLEIPPWDFLHVTVKGERCLGQRVLEEGNRVHVHCSVQAPESRFEIVIAPDKMEATLRVSYRPGERRVLEPTTPATWLRIEPRCISIDPSPVTLAQVTTELARLGVTSGLVPAGDTEKFLAMRTSGSLVVARGTEPRPGGVSVEIFWPSEGDNPWVVEAGTVIARWNHRPARTGFTVTGELLSAGPDESIREVLLGPGVTVMSQDSDVVANRKGAVTFSQGVLDVVPQHETESLAPTDEWLFFDGDLKVRGDVVDSRMVVLGNLFVAGDLRGCEVIVGGSVIVAGRTSESTVSVALHRHLRERTQHHVGRIIDGLYDLELTVEALASQLGARMGDALAKVVPIKFPEVMDSLNWLAQATSWEGLSWDARLQPAVSLIRDRLAPETLGAEEELEILWSLRTELEMLSDPLVEECPLGRHPEISRFQSVQRCRLDIEGVARIVDLRSSQVEGDEIVVERSLVGGFAVARRLIRVGVLGSPEETETSVEVRDSAGMILAQTAYPGAVMTVAGLRRQVASRQSDIQVAAAPKGGDNA